MLGMFLLMFQSGLKRLTGAIASYAALERFKAPFCLFDSLRVGDNMFIPAFWNESLNWFPYKFREKPSLRGEKGSLG